jgi:hypothetical protein
MGQFSIKRLLASVTLIAVGVATCQLVMRLDNSRLVLAKVALCGFPLIGAGIFCPAKRTMEGALIGLLLASSVLCAHFIP